MRWFGGRTILQTWGECQIDPARAELVAKLRDWASRFDITEDWLFTAALFTLETYAPDNPSTYQCYPERYATTKWVWHYRPTVRVKPFTANFGHDSHWQTGAKESWETFRRRMQIKFNQQLTEYRATIEAAIDTTQSDNFVTHAEWTVRYLKGEQAQQIGDEIYRKYSDPSNTVYRSIDRFARRIGLNLNTKRRIR